MEGIPGSLSGQSMNREEKLKKDRTQLCRGKAMERVNLGKRELPAAGCVFAEMHVDLKGPWKGSSFFLQGVQDVPHLSPFIH